MENTETSNEAAEDWAERLPAANYFEKAIDLTASFDRLLVSLYSALVAGIVVLLLREEVSFWVGGPLFIALSLFVLGIAHTLMHMAFLCKLLLLAEFLFKGIEVVPNPVEQDEKTVEAYLRTQAWAQRMYSAQLLYLLFGMGCGAIAVVIRFWQYAWRGGVLLLLAITAVVIIVSLIIIWRSVFRRFPPSLMGKKDRNGISEETD